MSTPTFKNLTSIVAWICFLMGLITVIAPTVIGFATGGMAGTVNTVEDGQLWMYRHGFAWLLGMAFFATYFFAVKVRKSLD